MTKVISFFEEALPRKVDRQQWRHVTGAFDATVELYDANGFVWQDDEYNPEGRPVYLFDETGERDLFDPLIAFEHPEDAIYVFGITDMDITKVVPAGSFNDVVRIDTPKAKPLWGCEAAAIVLAHKFVKGF